jgi:MarR family 2-MHQ and catechol resistance regulon transcriptional repressor
MPTHFKGPPDQVRALDTYIKLNRAAETLSADLSRGLQAKGLTEGQFGVLEVLLHRGPMNQRELGRKLLRSNANVSTVLENLERAGHVQRERAPGDRRAVVVSLTDQGRALVEGIFPEHAAAVARLMAALTEAEVVQLGALCRKLGLGVRQD